MFVNDNLTVVRFLLFMRPTAHSDFRLTSHISGHFSRILLKKEPLTAADRISFRTRSQDLSAHSLPGEARNDVCHCVPLTLCVTGRGA